MLKRPSISINTLRPPIYITLSSTLRMNSKPINCHLWGVIKPPPPPSRTHLMTIYYCLSTLGRTLQLAGSLLPAQGSNLHPQQWKHSVITPGWPGSLPYCFLISHIVFIRCFHLQIIFPQFTVQRISASWQMQELSFPTLLPPTHLLPHYLWQQWYHPS